MTEQKELVWEVYRREERRCDICGEYLYLSDRDSSRAVFSCPLEDAYPNAHEQMAIYGREMERTINILGDMIEDVEDYELVGVKDLFHTLRAVFEAPPVESRTSDVQYV